MTQENSKNYLVKVYEASTASEALVVRGLLASAGISAPDFGAAEPFPMNEPPEGSHDAEVWVPEPQAEDARRILAEFSNKADASGK